MNYRIVEKEAFRIVGLHKRVPIQFQGIIRILRKWRKA